MFKKEHRLAKTKDVKAAFEQGRGFFNPYFSVRHNAKAGQQRRFTVVVSTKVSKNATRRNRLKRLVREFARINMGNFLPGDYILAFKPKANQLSDPEVAVVLSKLLIQAKVYENQRIA
ncbi:MAG: ribonuclease P protein component [Patescibacteria group bacterium]|nr:ribonuclease P protein component [Patescibacteria group bacterium]